ncbi:peptide deformylase [Brevundimonas phage vB_BpoS-Marchewka]|uniref:Peptide deformylase n=1 Tax=Brevundimonas phage vB_BpoS-Marchewka TaxID=2948604 RepID=A0A9E7SSZ6_9CAUD|nr:peptide deformylase [Brevundimonas phage vB_BpoS-Marchewka]UTC29528.1 peptide deformylase [Brevundimonas phage vB_BpoS-Bambus]
MALRQIIPCTDARMTKPSDTVFEITDEVRALCFDMVDTMLLAEGAGLAAVQVGVPLRIFTMIDLPDVGLPVQDAMVDRPKLILINPTFVDKSEDMIEMPEGCLSMPGVFFPVRRHREVTVEYQDIHGRMQSLSGKGYKAICLQHEMDHLDGVRNIDRVSPLKRAMLLKKHQDNVRRMKRA